MDNALGNALVVEVKHLLAEMEVVHDQRTTRPDTQRILIVGDRAALGRRQQWHVALGDLMQFAPFAALHCLVVDLGSRSLGRNGPTGWCLGHGGLLEHAL